MSRKPIVVGVDGSPESLRAAELAAKIAHVAGAPLVPVNAVPAVDMSTGLVGLEPIALYSPELQERLTALASDQIAQALQKVVPAPAAQRLEVRTGPAPFVIAMVARRRRAQLVVLGGKQHGVLARAFGRSTAHYLIRSLDVPMLVAARSSASVARVLVAVDLSLASKPTIEAAEWVAKLFRARLRVLHVIEPLGFIGLPEEQVVQDEWQRRSRQSFDHLVSPLRAIAPEDRVVRDGPAADVIEEEAVTWGADLVVVGSHGKGWVDRVLVGSTTERLVTHLPTSVLVVPFKAIRRVAPTSKRTPRTLRRRAKPATRRRRR